MLSRTNNPFAQPPPKQGSALDRDAEYWAALYFLEQLNRLSGAMPRDDGKELNNYV